MRGAPAFANRLSRNHCVLDARKHADAGEKLFREGILLHRLLVMRVGKTEAHGEHVVGGAAEVACTELLVTLEQEARTEEKDDSEADFRGEERLAQLCAAAASAVRSGGA